ncbi:hypothetical protein BXZ70DRAFT_925185 [Cristinia sonorae]|uniref:DUF6534 domain-containing protein n=1 Tax=Cristinia sonorae TaxID=1940300 RepID=A0A8K0XS24_9AGAR|nr:hypothetical protein BXZ70DRAFT_925185 [Cristinia sonorae]
MSAPPSPAPGAGGMIPPGFDLSTLRSALGPLLVGGLFSTVLYGITCAQTFVFYQNSITDRWPLKLTVAILWIIDTFDVFLNCHILYHYLVTHFLDPFALVNPVWSMLLHVTVTGVSNFIVRGAFTRRVWQLSSKNWFLCAFITLASLMELVLCIIITAKAFGKTFMSLSALAPLFYADFAAVLAADMTVSLSLCFFLHMSRTGIKKTESLINILILYTINTGLLTAVDASAGLIMFAVMPDKLIYVTFYLQLSKLYVNAYLATLNARETLREKSFSNDPLSINLSKISRGTGGRPMQYGSPNTTRETESAILDNEGKRPAQLAITVTTHVDEEMDDQDVKQRKAWDTRSP